MAIGVPSQLGATATSTSSGSASSASTVDAPPGTFLFVPVNVGTAANVSVNSVTDTAGNTYNLIQPGAVAGITSACIAWIITNVDVPIGTTWTVNLSSATVYNLKGVWAVTGVRAGLDRSATLNQPSAGTSGSLSTGAMGNSNDLVVIYTYMNGSGAGANITTPHGFINLFNNTYNDISFLITLNSTASITANPTWSSSTSYSMVLAAFAGISISAQQLRFT